MLLEETNFSQRTQVFRIFLFVCISSFKNSLQVIFRHWKFYVSLKHFEGLLLRVSNIHGLALSVTFYCHPVAISFSGFAKIHFQNLTFHLYHRL